LIDWSRALRSVIGPTQYQEKASLRMKTSFVTVMRKYRFVNCASVLSQRVIMGPLAETSITMRASRDLSHASCIVPRPDRVFAIGCLCRVYYLYEAMLFESSCRDILGW